MEQVIAGLLFLAFGALLFRSFNRSGGDGGCGV
jgi:hypothetical protein